MNQNKIYVGNLSYNTTNEDLQSFFSQYGEISELKLIADYDGRSKGFGFITFATQEAAQLALQADGQEVQGRKIKVNMAKDKAEGGGRRGGNGGSGGRQGSGGHRQGGRNERYW